MVFRLNEKLSTINLIYKIQHIKMTKILDFFKGIIALIPLDIKLSYWPFAGICEGGGAKPQTDTQKLKIID